jgi:serine/threonine protein kinase
VMGAGGNVEQPNQSRLTDEPTRLGDQPPRLENQLARLGSQPGRPTTFDPGSTFGEYTIVRRIGRGGQGSVFEVRDGLGLTWALKVSEEMALHDANAEMRFAREARCVAENLSQLPRHSGVFVGEHYGVWDRRFYVKMKLLQGESLAQRLRRLGQLSIYEAVRVAERIACAIGQAHAMGVLHRDLKPENVFLTESGEVVVLDWGCLQLIEAGQQKTTLRGVVCTPGYAPIEQYLATTALNLTPAVDLYALGVMLYEALAGYHPFLNWSRAALPPPAPKSAVVSPEVSPCKEDVAGGSVLTVRSLDDVFGAQTERHTVPDELLAHLRGVVTGGVTWRSARDALPAKSPSTKAPSIESVARQSQVAPLGTANTQPLSAKSGESPSSGWTLSQPQVPAALSTRTMPKLNVALPNGDAVSPPGAAAPAAAVVFEQAERRAPKGEAPRRFSLIEVLAFQERVKPRPVDGISAELGALLLQLLAKRPTERPQDALVVAERLRRLMPQLLQSPAEFAESTPELNSRYLKRSLVWIRLRQSGRRWSWAAAGLAAAGLTGAGTHYSMSASRAAPSTLVTVEQALQAPAPLHSPTSPSSPQFVAAPPVATPPVATQWAPLPRPPEPGAALGVPMSLRSLETVPPMSAPDKAPHGADKQRRRKKRRGAEEGAAAVATAAAPSTPVSPPPPIATSPKPAAASAPCAAPCDPAGEAQATTNRRLQANPNAVLHRSSHKLWLE